MKSIRVLVVDDEAPARRRVKKLLQGYPMVEVVGEAASGRDATEAVRELNPELLFLDIQMPGLDGFEVLDRIPEPRPVVVFVTAYDQYALRAFEEHVVDYLLKPYDSERFDRCLASALCQVAKERTVDWQNQVSALLSDVVRRRAAEPSLDRLPVKTAERVYWVETSDIEYVQAAGKYVEIYAYGKRHLVRKPLGRFAAALGAERFLQIHRSYLVNVL